MMRLIELEPILFSVLMTITWITLTGDTHEILILLAFYEGV
jgi:hypothetical protein